MRDHVIAFDTATDVLAVGLARMDADRLSVLAASDEETPRAALSNLVPTIDRLLGEHRLAPSRLAAVVVGRGPGSFTGVRIGVASAKGLAHGLGVPLYGVGTLDAIAWRFADPAVGCDTDLLAVVGDAMRSEVYPAIFRIEAGHPVRQAADQVMSPAHAAQLLAEEPGSITLAGNALHKYRDELVDGGAGRIVVADAELWHPTGAGLLAAYNASHAATGAICAECATGSGDGDVGTLLPIYTRLSDAEENEHARNGTQGNPLPSSGVGGDPS